MQLLAPAPPRALAALVRPFVDALFPPRCPLCGARDAGAGFGCSLHVPALALPPPRCGRCARSLPGALPDAALCRECRTEPPAFESVIALAEYARDDAFREWILAFKHGGRPDLASVLGGALGVRLASVRGAVPADEHALLVPVPLHARRRFERGYDQAWLLARAAARVEGIAVHAVLTRTRATLPQGSPFAPEREANVRGAFRLARGAARRVAGRAVWLVDDVLTSGATASACAELVLAAGAASAHVLVLARAERRRGCSSVEYAAGTDHDERAEVDLG